MLPEVSLIRDDAISGSRFSLFRLHVVAAFTPSQPSPIEGEGLRRGQNLAGCAPELRGGERDAERGDVRLDPGREDPDFAQVADQPGVQVAAEIFAERGLVAAGGALAAEALDLLDVRLVETHLFIGV